MSKRKKKSSKIPMIIFIVLLLIGVAGGFYWWKSQNVVQVTPEINQAKKDPTVKKQVPTIFIHGYSGGRVSFGGMMKRLEKEAVAEKALVVTVAGDGSLKVEGKLNSKQKNPMVQVLFEENRTAVDNLQANWVLSVVKMLQNSYNIENFNAVGHSLGGVALLRYLTDYGTDTDLPKMDKLITIAAPFNGLVIEKDGDTAFDLTGEGPKEETERYQYFKKNFKNVPADLVFRSFAGDTGDGTLSDGSVSVVSAFAIRSLAEQHHLNYQERLFTGWQAKHSRLHENKEVDQALIDFLWNSSEKLAE